MRILTVIMIVLFLIIASSGVASANWGFDLVATNDSEDGCWEILCESYPPDATEWEIRYWSDTGYTLYTNYIELHIGEFQDYFTQGDYGNVIITPQDFNFGVSPFQDISWASGYKAAVSGDQGDHVILIFDQQENFTHLMGGLGVTDPEPQPLCQRIATLTSDVSMQLAWIEDVNFAVNENQNYGIPPTIIKTWRNSIIYLPEDNMLNHDMLLHDGWVAYTIPGTEASPVAPMPEIITIILVSLGLIALAIYVVYRRRYLAT